MNTQPPNTRAAALQFGYGDATLGTILVAVSNRGIAAIFLGEDRAKLLRDLKAAFPGATLVEDEAALSATIAKVVNLVDAPHLATDLRLDLQGSPLELAVWEALRSIPPGEVRTYGALAKTLPMAATASFEVTMFNAAVFLMGLIGKASLAAHSIADLVTWSGGLYQPPSKFRNW